MSENNVVDSGNESKTVLCKRCGRKLVGKRSLETGYGPRCYSIWKKERSQQLKLFEEGDGNIDQ